MLWSENFNILCSDGITLFAAYGFWMEPLRYCYCFKLRFLCHSAPAISAILEDESKSFQVPFALMILWLQIGSTKLKALIYRFVARCTTKVLLALITLDCIPKRQSSCLVADYSSKPSNYTFKLCVCRLQLAS